jgi:hypothetical protein
LARAKPPRKEQGPAHGPGLGQSAVFLWDY